MAKKARNPFAVCNAMKKRYGWGKAKIERCVKRVKRTMGKKY